MTTFAAILFLPFKAVLMLLQFLLKNKLLLIIVIVTVVVIFGINPFNKQNQGASAPVPDYQTIAPDIKTAPTIVATTSRVYYVVIFEDDEQVVTLIDWFSYDTKKWVRQKTPFPLDRAVYGEIKIIPR